MLVALFDILDPEELGEKSLGHCERLRGFAVRFDLEVGVLGFQGLESRVG